MLSDDPSGPQQLSMQRKWGTSQCRTKADALQTVVLFAYGRWNRMHPDDKKKPPTREEFEKCARDCP